MMYRVPLISALTASCCISALICWASCRTSGRCSRSCAAVQAEKQARIERDARWGEAHGDMTDDEILEYLRTCAEALGHAPYSYEVEGGRYIAERFVSWSIALTEAKLPLPKGIQKPRREQKLAFLARKNGCQPGRDPEAYTD